MTKFWLIVCALSIFKVAHEGITENTILICGIALMSFIFAAIAHSMAYDREMKKTYPNHFTTGDAVKVLGIFYFFTWLFSSHKARD